MTSSSYIDRIAALDACGPAVDWLRSAGHPDLASAWAVCPRADWMLWLAGRTAGPPGSDSRRPIVLVACACARTALPIYEAAHPGDLRPRRAVEAAEGWARGEATLDDVREAARGASVAAAAATAAAAVYGAAAAVAVAHGADASDASNTAIYAASAASATAYAVAASANATYAADRARVLADLADLVREHYPEPPSLEIA